MTTSFTIGELAQAAEVPVSTVRYYERRGLVRPDGRSASNYRIYGQKSLDHLLFIRAAQITGFQLRDIELLIELKSGEGNPCGEVRSVIETRLVELTSKMKALRHSKKILAQALEWCESGAASGRCGVLDKLTERPSR